MDTFFPLETLTQDIRDYIQHCPNANISVQREALNGTGCAEEQPGGPDHRHRPNSRQRTGQNPDARQAQLRAVRVAFAPFAAQRKPVCKKQRLNDIVVVIADSSHELPKRNHGTLPLQRQLVVCDVEATRRCSNAASATLFCRLR